MNCTVCQGAMDVRYGDFLGTRLMSCTDCGFEMQETDLHYKNVSDIYGSDYFDTYGETGAVEQKKRYYNRLLDDIGLSPESRVLEIGCGTGIFLSTCIERGIDAFGIDINPAGLEIASETVPPQRLMCGDVEALSDEIQGFDAIFMLDYIEHIRDPGPVLGIAFEKLNQAGRLIISTPSSSSVSNKVMGRKWPHYIEEHQVFFSERAMYMVLTGIGYRDVNIRTYNKIVTPEYLFSQVIGKEMGIAPIVAFCYRFVPGFLRRCHLSMPTGDILAVARK